MSDIEYTFARPTEAELNKVTIAIVTEEGCKISEGEYTILLVDTKNPIECDPAGGETELYHITNCIDKIIDDLDLPEHGTTTAILVEKGEWQNVFWVRWYELLGIIAVDPNEVVNP